MCVSLCVDMRFTRFVVDLIVFDAKQDGISIV